VAAETPRVEAIHGLSSNGVAMKYDLSKVHWWQVPKKCNFNSERVGQTRPGFCA
jgi:hypothetical protein